MKPTDSLELLAIVHELKNRLMLLDGQLVTAIAAKDSSQCEALLVGARANVGQMANWLTVQIVSAKARSKDLKAFLGAQDIFQFFNVLGERIKPAMRCGVSLEIELIDAPIIWVLDNFLVDLAIACAVDNALRHAHSWVRLVARVSDEGLVLEVKNDLNPEDSCRAQTGTGLGLILCEAIAKVHNYKSVEGRMSFTKSNESAHFSLMLP